MKTFTQILKGSCLAVALMSGMSVSAQEVLPENSLPVIVTAHAQSVSAADRHLHFDVTANVDYTATADVAWLSVDKSVNGVYVHVKPNYVSEQREGKILFANAEKGISQTLTITQAAYQPTSIPDDITIKPSGATANTSNSGAGIDKTIDGDYSTIYHSQWSGSRFTVSESNPAELIYTFTNVDQIDYINYVPRQDGSSNGYFTKVEVYVRTQGNSGYSLYGTYNWASSSSPKTINFEGGLKNPTNIMFRVLAGTGNYASCAEMEFRKISEEAAKGYSIFADDLYSTLKPGITISDLDDIDNSLVQSLGHQLLDGTYSTDYRVASFQCYNSPQYYSDQWNAPGKYYDQLAGVTGINITKGKHAIIVRDIPEGADVALKVMAWYIGKESNDLSSGINPVCSTFALKNGLNIINYTYDWPGLAYVCYYSYGESASMPPIRMHFVNGEAQGYLTADLSNEEMHKMTANAKNTCMDLFGKRVHSIWTAEGLHNYCKASDGTSVGYRQYINFLDTLVTWEQRLLGFEKYNRLPDLRTMAYVNYTYYMFQGGWGVSFHHSTESGVLNCRTMMYNNYDYVWGLSHEWGHQHQMSPYFNWCGMTEVTNNLNSYYNTYSMGYSNYGHGCMPSDGTTIYNGVESGILSANDQTVYTTIKNTRAYAYKNRNNYSWNTNLYNLCNAMKDSTWTDKEKNGVLSYDYTNYGTCRPYIALLRYCMSRLGLNDFGPDLYEALRQTDDANGSQIEKTGAVDKYELIASAQNYNKNSKLAVLRSSYPSSVWVKNNYITTDHCDRWGNSVPFIMNYIRKASRLCGYNLFPYFERCGMLRQVAIHTYDGNWYLMTADMYNEFKEDMEALGLKECSDAMVKAILTVADPATKTPTIPN